MKFTNLSMISLRTKLVNFVLKLQILGAQASIVIRQSNYEIQKIYFVLCKLLVMCNKTEKFLLFTHLICNVAINW